MIKKDQNDKKCSRWANNLEKVEKVGKKNKNQIYICTPAGLIREYT